MLDNIKNVYFYDILNDIHRTRVTSYQRLVGEMVDKFLERWELVETKHIGLVHALHVEMLH